MKFPLFCSQCDMLTYHEAIIPLKAECNRCKTVRSIPIIRWIILSVILLLIIGLPIYYIFFT